MKFIPYAEAHFDTCIALFRSNLPKYFAENEEYDFIHWLSTGQIEHYFLIEDNSEIVGCAGVFVDEEKEECGFAWGMIRHDLHGNGYGKSMSEYRIKLLKEICPYPIRLGTTQHTYHFYEKMGFEVTEIQKDGFQLGMDKYTMFLK